MSSDKHGQVWWTEFNTWDADAAMHYYGPMMGWSFREMPTAGSEEGRPYYIAMKDDRPVAGIFTMFEPNFENIPDHWFVYLSVDDIRTGLERHEHELGGVIIRPPFEIPGFGTLAIVRDTVGGHYGMIEPVQQG